MQNVAATVPVPDGKTVRVMSGQVTLSGEALANANGPQDEVLVVAGQLIITTPVKHVGFAQLITMGQVLAPVGSETALGAGLSRMSGQVAYYPYTEGAAVRVRIGTTRLTPTDLAAWQAMRQELDFRAEARRAQHRFRHDPAAYLATLESQLLQSSLPP